MCKKIRARAKETGDLVVAYPLYSKLDQKSIAAAVNPDHRCGLQGEMMTATSTKSGGTKKQVRKVIACTNLAETSLTIDGVRFVIESGRANKVKYDHKLRCSVLSERFVSHASTIQR
jgi:HrpA-like RNA helicase